MHNEWKNTEDIQKQLNSLLKELATKKTDNIEIIANQICEIYSTHPSFRHRYSDFLPLILEVAKEDSNQGYNIEKIDPFGENLNKLKEYVKNKEDIKENVLKSIFKLTDHINLEIGRFKESIAKEDRIKILEKQNTKTTNELNRAIRKLHSVQTELIAVLSIFAAIVLTFSGSMSFIAGALQCMEKTPFLKATFFIALCGFIIFNLIYLMIYLVAKITERNIYAQCKTENCISCGKKCIGINKIRKRLPYVFWTNIFLIITMCSVIIYKILIKFFF